MASDDEDEVSPGIALLDAMKAARPAQISNAEREADKAEIAKLRADLILTQRAVVDQGNRIRSLKADLAAVRGTVIELQRQRRPARTSATARKRDGLDDALERDLYE